MDNGKALGTIGAVIGAVVLSVVAHLVIFAILLLVIGVPIVIFAFYHPGSDKDTAQDTLDLISKLSWIVAGLFVAAFLCVFFYVAATKA